MTTADKINEAAAACWERGREPKIAWVGAEALAELLTSVFYEWKHPRRLTMYTCAGEVDIQVRTSLDTAVIIEDTRGEPWIQT